MKIAQLTDCDIQQKKLLIRVDLNVPIQEGIIQNDARIRAIIPTLQYALSQKAAIILLSHLGRPLEGIFDPKLSLKPIADYLQHILSHPVRFESNWLEGVDIQPGEVVLCENVRFNRGERNNDPVLAKRMADLGDIFVMDAFATAHRSEASTVGVGHAAQLSVAGPLLMQELKALSHTLQVSKRPLVAVLGGAKISDKLPLIRSLIEAADTLLLGGGLANTFLAALGYPMGSSLYEPSFLEEAKTMLAYAEEKKVTLLLPTDVILAETLSDDAYAEWISLKAGTSFSPTKKILDIGPKTIQRYKDAIQSAGTIIWNGPLGVFEVSKFSKGTEKVAKAIAASEAHSLVGGGETLAVVDRYELGEQISYLSTGGAAFLEYLEGKTLPAIGMLEAASAKRDLSS